MSRIRGGFINYKMRFKSLKSEKKVCGSNGPAIHGSRRVIVTLGIFIVGQTNETNATS